MATELLKSGSRKAGTPSAGPACQAEPSRTTPCGFRSMRWPTISPTSCVRWSCRADRALVAHNLAREAGEDRCQDRAPRTLGRRPTGRGGGAARAVRRDPAADRSAPRTAAVPLQHKERPKMSCVPTGGVRPIPYKFDLKQAPVTFADAIRRGHTSGALAPKLSPGQHDHQSGAKWGMSVCI